MSLEVTMVTAAEANLSDLPDGAVVVPLHDLPSSGPRFIGRGCAIVETVAASGSTAPSSTELRVRRGAFEGFDDAHLVLRAETGELVRIPKTRVNGMAQIGAFAGRRCVVVERPAGAQAPAEHDGWFLGADGSTVVMRDRNGRLVSVAFRLVAEIRILPLEP